MAKEGIAKKIGDKNMERPNKIAITNDVNPVLPPSETPVALSTYVVTVEVPSQHLRLFL